MTQYVPVTRAINGVQLGANVVLTAANVNADVAGAAAAVGVAAAAALSPVAEDVASLMAVRAEMVFNKTVSVTAAELAALGHVASGHIDVVGSAFPAGAKLVLVAAKGSLGGGSVTSAMVSVASGGSGGDETMLRAFELCQLGGNHSENSGTAYLGSDLVQVRVVCTVDTYLDELTTGFVDVSVLYRLP